MGEKYVYLIRHAEYGRGAAETGGGGPGLTPIGREQARLTAAALAAEPISAIHTSTLRRAEETAAAIAARFPALRVRRAHVLRECLPCVPVLFAQRQSAGLSYDLVQERLRADASFRDEMGRPFAEHGGTDPAALPRHAAQAERAFARFFTPTRRRSWHEVLVGHGNLIQYLVCRALRVDPTLWANLPARQCGVTRIVVRDDGVMFLFSHGDVGHLPRELRLF